MMQNVLACVEYPFLFSLPTLSLWVVLVINWQVILNLENYWVGILFLGAVIKIVKHRICTLELQLTYPVCSGFINLFQK